MNLALRFNLALPRHPDYSLILNQSHTKTRSLQMQSKKYIFTRRLSENTKTLDVDILQSNHIQAGLPTIDSVRDWSDIAKT